MPDEKTIIAMPTRKLRMPKTCVRARRACVHGVRACGAAVQGRCRGGAGAEEYKGAESRRGGAVVQRGGGAGAQGREVEVQRVQRVPKEAQRGR
jgi:hypothetical protein